MDSKNAATETLDPSYPIGRFQAPEVVQPWILQGAMSDIAELPQALRNAVQGLNDAQLRTPYREGGWEVRQLVHHIADSHMNMFIRVRLALTEDAPQIRPYDETTWALLHDSTSAPIEWSLELLEALHARWTMLLQSLTPEQWQRTFIHPETGTWTLERATLYYAWHSRHHTAHITHLRAEHGW